MVTAAKRLARRILPDRIYRVLRQRRVARIVGRYEPRDHTDVYGGHRLTLRIADPLGEGWYGGGWESSPEIAMLRQLGAVRNGARVFDLGAHQAVVALMLGREVGPDGRVLAVEGEPHNVRVAEWNVRANDAANVTILHAAITDRDGTAYFSESLNGFVGETSAGNVEVPAWTVDTLAEKYWQPDLVFMDIEGYEGRALRSAARTVHAGATFFVEVHVETLVGATAEEVAGFFHGRDLYIAADPTANTCHFERYAGGPLPERRFYLVAAQAAAPPA